MLVFYVLWKILLNFSEMIKSFCDFWFSIVNLAFRKILVFDLWPKMISANQIVGFLKLQYLKK